MTIKNNKYKDDSIISLNPRDFTRLRPSTYLGGNEYSTQLVKEIFSNALDEHIIGNGNQINITIDTSRNTYSVEDNGQGFPINVVREDKETVLQAAFDVINTSGKYDDDGVYQGSVVGLNGIGSKLTNFLSTELDVISYSGKEFEHIWFKDGIFERKETGKDAEHQSGTIVTWSPDPQFFQSVDANIPELKRIFEDISALCPALTIEFTVDGVLSTYHAENGIQDLLKNKIGKKELLNNRFYIRKTAGSNLFDIAITYCSEYSESITAYVNYGLTESGIHISTIKTLMLKQINKYAQENGLLKRGDTPLIQSELSEGLVLVFNIKANNVKYDSQTKVRVVDLDKSLINETMNNDFALWVKGNPKDVKIIVDRALTARKAREASEKAKDAARGLKTAKKDKFLDLPTKLVDANPKDKDRSKCTLYCVEGDSAGNGLVPKRDGERHGIMPLRGKILSVRKASVQDMYKNQEISNIVKALGLEVNVAEYTLKYDLKRLRYHKIVLLEDGDPDGAAIRMLLITLFWRLCPELVINGHLYSSRPPLYKVTDSKNNYSYCTDDAALTQYKAAHKREHFTVNRLKGLGEMSPDELYECMMTDDNDNILQITVDDVDEADKTLEMFMGTNVTDRREYYNKHYNDVEIDIE